MNYIRNKRVLALTGIITLILGTILPYFTFSLLGYSQSISLWKYWEGKLIIILTLVNALFIFKDYIEKYLPQLFTTNLGKKIANLSNPKVSLIPTILVVGFVIYLNIKFDFNTEYLKNGLGFYLLWLGIICLVVHAIVYKKPSEALDNVNHEYNNQNVNLQQNFQQSVQSQTQQLTQNELVNKKLCPNCGNQVDETATQCFMCGNKF